MTEILETYEKNNIKVEISFDLYPDNPRECEDSNFGTLICFHSRYSFSDNENYTVDELKKHIEKDTVLSLPVYLYEHGNVALNTTGFNCPWDSGQVGYIFVSHDKIIEECGSLDLKKAKEWLKSEISTLDQWAEGDVYFISVSSFKAFNTSGLHLLISLLSYLLIYLFFNY